MVDSLRLPFEHTVDFAVLRHRARQFLARQQSPETIDDTLLVITELVENVVQHTDAGGELVLRRHNGTVGLEVADSSPASPQVYRPNPRRIGGRGLLLITALTQSWEPAATCTGRSCEPTYRSMIVRILARRIADGRSAAGRTESRGPAAVDAAGKRVCPLPGPGTYSSLADDAMTGNRRGRRPAR